MMKTTNYDEILKKVHANDDPNVGDNYKEVEEFAALVSVTGEEDLEEIMLPDIPNELTFDDLENVDKLLDQTIAGDDVGPKEVAEGRKKTFFFPHYKTNFHFISLASLKKNRFFFNFDYRSLADACKQRM